MSFHLSTQETNAFEENGYLVVHELFDAAAVATMTDAIDKIVGAAAQLSDIAELEPSDPTVIRRIWKPSSRHAAFRTVQEDARILDRLESLIGPDIMFHHSKLNMKGPRVGSPVEWHQDLSYYPHTNTKLIACLVYLDDASESNGCVRVLAGSHKTSIYDHTENGFFRGKVGATALPSGCNEVSVGGKAGTAVFLHCKVLHRSEPNRSPVYRRCFIPAYRAADALPIYYGPHAAHNEPDTYLLRGEHRHYVTSEASCYPLPITEKAFNSLYALQQGEHVLDRNPHAQSSGYATQPSGNPAADVTHA
jgi:phytanoyl-CoA hydroxylase